MTAVLPPHGRYRWSSSAPWTVLAAAASYYVAGRLALLLAIPPGHASPIWPAAGFALASVLLAGGRVWPGIWLGSFLLNLTMLWDGASDLGAALAIAAVVGTGTALQAL